MYPLPAPPLSFQAHPTWQEQPSGNDSAYRASGAPLRPAYHLLRQTITPWKVIVTSDSTSPMTKFRLVRRRFFVVEPHLSRQDEGIFHPVFAPSHGIGTSQQQPFLTLNITPNRTLSWPYPVDPGERLRKSAARAKSALWESRGRIDSTSHAVSRQGLSKRPYQRTFATANLPS